MGFASMFYVCLECYRILLSSAVHKSWLLCECIFRIKTVIAEIGMNCLTNAWDASISSPSPRKTHQKPETDQHQMLPVNI